MIRPKIGNIKTGSSQGKNTNIIVFDFADVDITKWPVRDTGKINMVGNIVFLPGKYIQEIYATSSTISLPRTSDGDEDAVSFSAIPEFSHPGSPLEIEEFIAKRTNRQLGVAVGVGACDGETPFYRVYGSPCNPLRLMVEGQDNNEAVKDLMKFEQARKSSILPGRYTGTWARAQAFAVPVDTAIVDVTEGPGEYQLADNTAATTITDISNAVNGAVYTLIGSGGANPATILAANAKFLLTGVDWQGLANAKLTVKAFDNGTNLVFIEQSRS